MSKTFIVVDCKLIDGYTLKTKFPCDSFKEYNFALETIRSGFWINDEGKQCDFSDGGWFIMPHHIISVVKVNV